MIYRRFGKTEIQMPVLSFGCMRFQQSWKDIQPSELDKENQKNVEAILSQALNLGINHIETARGYGSSEYQLGRVLPDLPREKIIVQTKVGPRKSEEEFLESFHKSYSNIGLEYIDLLAIHGINTLELLDRTLNAGTLSACRKLQKDGKVGHIGFSTHAASHVVIPAIETGEFSFVNLHWYYFDQWNTQAIRKAEEYDTGVFIISPSDKGGRLYDPPSKLVDLCKPFSPMQFNDLFCLTEKGVQTISTGAKQPGDFQEHINVIPLLKQGRNAISVVDQRLRSEFASVMGENWAADWQKDLPHTVNAPDPFPLYMVLRLYNLAKTYDMVDYARSRYNLLGNSGHWVPGEKVNKIDWRLLEKAIAGYPFADRVPDILREAHEWFDEGKKKRLSESES